VCVRTAEVILKTFHLIDRGVHNFDDQTNKVRLNYKHHFFCKQQQQPKKQKHSQTKVVMDSLTLATIQLLGVSLPFK